MSTLQVMGYVYFIQANNAIKIGFAKDVRKRMGQLQTSHPDTLILLGMHGGDVTTETSLHTRFSDARIRGEWFQPTPEI